MALRMPVTEMTYDIAARHAVRRMALFYAGDTVVIAEDARGRIASCYYIVMLFATAHAEYYIVYGGRALSATYVVIPY